MEKLIISKKEDFEVFQHKELSPSPYLLISQGRIDNFADATNDHQWIHCDTDRALKESPYGRTIAHGYLTVSLIPHLFTQILEVRDYSLVVNYEIQNIKFMQPVPVGGEIRLKAEIYEVKYIRDMTKVQFKVAVEIKGEKKPALQGKIVFLYQF